jgi:hypothetical protein
MYNAKARVYKHHNPTKIEAKTKGPNSERKYYNINNLSTFKITDKAKINRHIDPINAAD